MIKDTRHFDWAIIGAGVVGCAISRELSQHSDLRIALIEQNRVGSGATLNSGGFVRVVHSEIMLSPDGPVLIEVGARIHGGYTPKTVQSFSSVSQLELSVYAYTDIDKYIITTNHPPIFYKNALVYFFISHQDGIIERIIEDKELENLDSYFSSVWNISKNSPINKTVDLLTSPGWVVLMNESKEKLLEDKAKIMELEKNGQLY
ncbi:FAD-dependent oxidoreductase [Thorsellia kenyensis]|uniref:FAD-dependent oxidoreductase n=1 Tax=Thorsellia kenyensis TaxID=1549888 RepID=A0ABV6C8H2_9GAMM